MTEHPVRSFRHSFRAAGCAESAAQGVRQNCIKRCMTGRLWHCTLGRHRARGTGVRDYSFPVLQLITPLQADAALSARRLRQLVSTLRPFGPPLVSTLRLTPSLVSTPRPFGSRFQFFVLRIWGCSGLLVAGACLVHPFRHSRESGDSRVVEEVGRLRASALLFTWFSDDALCSSLCWGLGAIGT
jgi:hypothetical protein